MDEMTRLCTIMSLVGVANIFAATLYLGRKISWRSQVGMRTPIFSTPLPRKSIRAFGRKCTAPGLKVLWVYYWLYICMTSNIDSLSPYLIYIFFCRFFSPHKRQLVLDKQVLAPRQGACFKIFAENQAMRSLWHEHGTVAGWFLQDLLPENNDKLVGDFSGDSGRKG